MIRSLQAADAAAVATLIRAAFAPLAQSLDPPPSALRETEASILEHLAQGGGAVAEQGGITACVLWSEREGGLYISRLATVPGRRGQGLATALMREAEAEARRRALPRIHLGVRLALPGNRRLFARLGFTETTRHAHKGHAAPTWTAAEKRLATAPPPGTGTLPG